MTSFLWQLFLGAGRETLALLGTKPLGWLYPFIILAVLVTKQAIKAERGKRWKKVKEKWTKDLKDTFWASLVCSALFFSFELLWGVPSTIWKKASKVQQPSILFRAPPATIPDPVSKPDSVNAKRTQIPTSPVQTPEPAGIEALHSQGATFSHNTVIGSHSETIGINVAGSHNDVHDNSVTIQAAPSAPPRTKSFR